MRGRGQGVGVAYITKYRLLLSTDTLQTLVPQEGVKGVGTFVIGHKRHAEADYHALPPVACASAAAAPSRPNRRRQ